MHFGSQALYTMLTSAFSFPAVAGAQQPALPDCPLTDEDICRATEQLFTFQHEADVQSFTVGVQVLALL